MKNVFTHSTSPRCGRHLSVGLGGALAACVNQGEPIVAGHLAKARKIAAKVQ